MSLFYPHQLEAIDSILTQFKQGSRAFLLADDVGLGKSRVACEIASCFAGELNVTKVYGVHILVVAPLSTFGGWLSEARAVGFDLTDDPNKKAAGYLINYEKLDRYYPCLVPNRLDLVIWDEAHRLKSYRAKRHALFMKLRTHSRRMLFLTATPAQSPLEMKYLGDVLGFAPTQFWGWLKGWRGCFKNRWGGWDYRRHPADEVRMDDLMNSSLSLRRHAGEIAGWPELQRIITPVALDDLQRLEYRDAFKDYLDALREEGRSIRAQAIPLVQAGQFRKRLSKIKWDTSLEMALGFAEQGMVPVVSCEYLDPAITLCDHLQSKKLRVGLMLGSTNEHDRRILLDRSATDELDAIVTTCFEGVNLHQMQDHHRKRVHIIHDIRWSALQQHQVEGRVHRAGRHALVYWLVCQGTVDERVARKLADRMATMNALLQDSVDDLLLDEIVNTQDA